MQTGFQTNMAKAEMAESLLRIFPAITNGAASELVEKITALLDAGIGIQSHPGSPLTNM